MDNLDLIDVNEELIEAEEGNIALYRAPKIYLSRQNPFGLYDDVSFKQRYRMSKETARFVIDLVRPQLPEIQNHRGSSISVDIQVLATIRYLAKGAYGVDVAEQHGISQPALSKIIKKVVVAIAQQRGRFILFPTNEAINNVKTDFYRIAGCPGIVGAVDGTHVKVKCPGGENPQIFMNRKGFYSLNVQVISDAKCRITDIVARWRGSVHDSRIWNECAIKRKFHGGEIQGILLGDNGYPSSRYLLTPVLNPRTEAEIRYNRAHCSTRNVVERLFGIWKNKFRCFFNGMHLKLETTKAAIIALAVLHNITINDRIENTDSDDEIDEPEEEHLEAVIDENIHGNVFRREYIESYFN